MFKIGDVVKCLYVDPIKGASRNCTGHLTVGKSYKILKIFDNMCVIINDKNRRDEYSLVRFEVAIHIPPKDDIEWMNRVQENFKE